MAKDEKFRIEIYAQEDEWRGNYVRAQWAGRVLEDPVFEKVLTAISKGEIEGKSIFESACNSVMQDVPEGVRKKLIRDMWAATWASRKLGDQNKSCW